MKDKCSEIIKNSLKIFMKEGIRKPNMDDIARTLKISKKTLYLHVKNKTDLVEKAFMFYQSIIIDTLEKIQEEELNPIDELFKIDKQICILLKNRPKNLVNNLKTYYPSVWDILIGIRQNSLLESIKLNLDRGISLRLYRSDLNTLIISKLLICNSDNLVDEQLFPLEQFEFESLLRENRIFHIRGIATEKGIRYLTKKIIHE